MPAAWEREQARRHRDTAFHDQAPVAAAVCDFFN